MDKPKDSMHNYQCCTCGRGRYRLKKINWRDDFSNVFIKDIWVEECEKCGEMLFSYETCKEITRQIKKKYPNY